jgi:hypothetical protein
MDDKIVFPIILIGGVIVVLMGFSMAGAGTVNFADAFSSSSDLLASVSSAFGRDTSQKQAYISYNGLTDIYPAFSDKNASVRVLDAYAPNSRDMYVATTHGLIVSHDTGLNFKQYVAPNGEITASSLVFRILPVGGRDTTRYYVSVFENGTGVVYYTPDGFVTLKKLLDFKDEAAYDLYASGSVVFFGMSNGQLLRFDTATEKVEVLKVFSEPIFRMTLGPDGDFYIQLKSGTLLRGPRLGGQFRVIGPRSGGFLSFGGSQGVQYFMFSNEGMLFVVTADGVYYSTDAGASYTFLKDIPLLKQSIDAFSIHNDVIYVVSEGRLLTSTDGGTEWKIRDFLPGFRPFRFFFLDNQRVIITG